MSRKSEILMSLNSKKSRFTNWQPQNSTSERQMATVCCFI